MKRVLMGAAVLLLASTGAARAQEADGFAGALAAGTNLLGEAIGSAVSDRSGILVTGLGHATLAEAPGATFEVNVDGKSASAVEAATIRDGRLKQLRDVAQKFGVEMETGDSGFSMEPDTAAQAKRFAENQAARSTAAGHPGATPIFNPFDANNVPQLFVAKTGVRFTQPSSERMAAFLDALKAAGVDDLATMLNSNQANSFLRQTFQVLGFGVVGKVDDAVWAKAAADAVANARKQAENLAAAAGRSLGPAEQVTYVARSNVGKGVTVAVAVRFAFLPLKTP
jgi:uncharacterized protein YggE